MTTRKAVFTDDLQAAWAGGSVVHFGLERDPRLPRSSVALPMLLDGRVVGVVELQRYELAAYTAAHVHDWRTELPRGGLSPDLGRVRQPRSRHRVAFRGDLSERWRRHSSHVRRRR